MNNQEKTVELLSKFNNMTFNRNQWAIILKGCGCPKSSHFWTALTHNCLQKKNKLFTLVDMDIQMYAMVLTEYQTLNRQYVRKNYQKKKARQKVNSFKSITFYMVNGYLTTENPIED